MLKISPRLFRMTGVQGRRLISYEAGSDDVESKKRHLLETYMDVLGIKSQDFLFLNFNLSI